MIKAIIKRFLKGFITGGITSAAVILKSGIVIASVTDAKKLGTALLIAFITGGLLAIEKGLSWTQEPPAPQA